jgi:hypothetical protein
LYFLSMRAIIVAILAAVLAVAAAPAPGGAAVDTTAARAASDSLRAARAAARAESGLFRGDGASASEMLRYRALTSVSVPFSLSSSLNRLLHYGNPAPPRAVGASDAAITARLPFAPYSPRFFGSDLLSGAQADSFSAEPLSGLSYSPYPAGALAFPELAIFWENGVFDENTLNLRLSRPLSSRLMFSAHTQYRFLDGLRFDHAGNDVANFYKTLYADTSKVMDKGYNPRVDESFMGAALRRANADSSTLYAAFSYADLRNEYALDLPVEALDKLKWAALGRNLYRFDASVTDKAAWALRVNAKAAVISESLRSSYDGDTSVANGSGGALSFAADADAALPTGAGLAVRSMVKRVELFSGGEKTFSEHRAEAFYKREFKYPGATAAIDASAGAALFLGFDTLYTPVYDNGILDSARARATAAHAAPSARAVAAVSPEWGRARLSFFAELSPYAVYPDYGPPRYAIRGFDIPYGGVWANSSAAFGAEAQAQTRLIGVLVGYRNQANDDLYLLRSLWPEGYPPYRQPRNTLIIAPWTERVAGFALLSRVIITDTKPFVKASACLSHTAHPAGMGHAFETEVGFDYWSANEPFALGSYPTAYGYYGWNDPVFDLNVKVAARIKSFRLFYKIDNLLNRKLSYVPGYFSPGVTFRWGLNWFLL